MLEEKLVIADSKQKLSLGVSVHKNIESLAKLMATECSKRYFTSDESLNTLKALKDKYCHDNRAKVAHTLLLALIRCIVSREIDIFEEDLGLESGMFD